MTDKRMNKAQFVTTLAEKSGLDKKQIQSALDAMNAIVAQHCGYIDEGEFNKRVAEHEASRQRHKRIGKLFDNATAEKRQ
jgi:nucleoid DNA-binding protein